MPGRDGTGPRGEGAMTGRGLGGCRRTADLEQRVREGQGLGTGWGQGRGPRCQGVGGGRQRWGRRLQPARGAAAVAALRAEVVGLERQNQRIEETLAELKSTLQRLTGAPGAERDEQ